MNNFIDFAKRNEAWKQIRSTPMSAVVSMNTPVQPDSGEWQDPWSPPKK